jgi:hypothetical protein
LPDSKNLIASDPTDLGGGGNLIAGDITNIGGDFDIILEF